MYKKIHTTLEDSQKLAEAGWEDETVFCYAETDFRGKVLMLTWDAQTCGYDYISAPTVEEIELSEGWAIGKCNGKFEVFYYTTPVTNVYHEVFETELKARVYIWLLLFGKKEAEL